MDTVRLKFTYNLNAIAKANLEQFFCEEIPQRKLKMTNSNKGSKPVLTNNAWRKERRKSGLYTPKYWIERDFTMPQITYFVIELSIPKLIFGTSAIAAKSEHLSLAVQKIKDFCSSIGIFIFEKQILETMPTALAFGKNIDITKIGTCIQAISILSLFNDRFRSDCYIIRLEKGGIELYFNSKSSTFKFYDKLREIKNDATTPEEAKIVAAYLQKGYGMEDVWSCEVLRAELTLKDTTAIKKRLRPYCGESITFEKVFNENIWNDLLKNEIERIFKHQISEYVFLSTLQANTIQAFLDKNIKHNTTKLLIKDAIEKIQRTGGTKGLKEYYFETYKSRATYYNHLKMLNGLMKNINLSEVENLTASKIHRFLLKQFGLDNSFQDTLF